MKKIAFLLAVVMLLSFAGCTVSEKGSKDEEEQTYSDKFFIDGDTYTADFFVEMADTFEGILDGERQQAYVFDLRSKEEYDKGHIVGSIHLQFDPAEAEALVEKLPSDFSIYIIGKNDEEAKAMVSSLKAIDEQLFVYIIEGGYPALLRAEGIEKYITTVPGEFTGFTRTEAEKRFNELVEKGIAREVHD